MYIYQATLFCDSCGQAIMTSLGAKAHADTDGGSDYYPQYIARPGKEDSITHCDSGFCCGESINLSEYGLAAGAPLFGMESRFIGALLTEELTSDGAQWLRETLEEDDKNLTPYQRALYNLWEENFGEYLTY